MTIKILGVKINLINKDEVLEEIKKYLIKSQIPNPNSQKKGIEPFVIFTPNPEIINYAQKDSFFKQIVNSAQINIPDGAGLCFAIERKFHLKTVRLSGTDLMRDICNSSSKNSFTIGLIGGRGSVALETRECLLRDYPNLKIEVLEAPEIQVASSEDKVVSSKYQAVREKEKIHSTYYLLHTTKEKQDEKTERYFHDLVNEIFNQKIDILFVALGFPKQEYFIENIKYQVASSKYGRPLVMMGVGGAFDYISGRVKRAPLWMREKRLEWLFRLIQEPWRLVRMLRGGRFFYKVIKSNVLS